MKVIETVLGYTKADEAVKVIRLEQENLTAEFLDYGATIRSLLVKDSKGQWVDVVLGYDTVAEYENNSGYLGASIGRYANRIGKGTFALNGNTYTLACNNGVNHLHGGRKGFDKHIWHYEILPDGVRFTRTSPDGEEGYPGNLEVAITYTLRDTTLEMDYKAVSDQDTICSLTNHSYYNLNGSGDVLAHTLQICADAFTENDRGCLPTGRLIAVAGTPFDFRRPKAIGQDIAKEDEQLTCGRGYDHNFALVETEGLHKAAVLHSDDSGITMTVHTTLPGVQMYAANLLINRKGKNGAIYQKHYGVCLETQYFPNAMACEGFEKPILRRGETYHHQTALHFSLD